MPIVKCPNCGSERLVVEGKKKNCRKCGTPLSTIPPKPPKVVTFTAEQLKEQYPRQVAEITEQAKAEIVREEIGEVTTEILLSHYPELVSELIAAAKEEAKNEALAELSEEMVRTGPAVTADLLRKTSPEIVVEIENHATQEFFSLSAKEFAKAQKEFKKENK